MPQQHTLDQLVESLADWIEETSDFLAEAMLEDGRAPFEAKVTEAQRFQYFNTLLWNPDGTPNVDGRKLLMDQHGLDEYVRIYRYCERLRNREPRGTTKGQKATTSDSSYDGS